MGVMAEVKIHSHAYIRTVPRAILFYKANIHRMSIVHGIRTLGVLGAGQMGTGIALVSALRARVPVLLYDRSTEQVTK